jgi:hypothetical protein
VGWHTQRDNLVVCTKLIKVWCCVASMAVKDKEPPCPDCTRLCVSVEVTYPLKTKLICCPPVVTDCDSPVRWEVLIPASLVELARQYHEQWKTPARRVDTLNRCNPLLVAWLYDSCPTHGVRACNYLSCGSHSHYKARLIKVVYIAIKYPVRDAYVLYKLKP